MRFYSFLTRTPFIFYFALNDAAPLDKASISARMNLDLLKDDFVDLNMMYNRYVTHRRERSLPGAAECICPTQRVVSEPVGAKSCNNRQSHARASESSFPAGCKFL